MKTTLQIVKTGGALLEDPQSFERLMTSFTDLPGPKILVHGGGQRASALERQLGLQPQVVDGRRITSQESLEVVVMVYGGWFNKRVVAALQGRGCNAIGLSGADANLVHAQKRPVQEIDYGYVGDVQNVATKTIEGLLSLGLTPVFCALTHDGHGQLLNTNADTIASELAIALGTQYEVVLNFLFDQPGVLAKLGDPSSLIAEMDREAFGKLKAQGVIYGGLLPKLHNCFQALEQGVQEIRIGNLDMLQDAAHPQTKLTL